MKTRNFFLCLFFSLIALSFVSCDEPETFSYNGYGAGVLVVCEGDFGSNNGAVTFISDSSVSKDVFAAINSRPLGDVVQSLTKGKETGYIVVNNSQKIECVDLETFESVGTIKGLSFPRYALVHDNDYVYVTNGNGYAGNFVYVINQNTLEIEDSIATGAGPDNIYAIDSKIFVANMGGWINDSTVSVINAHTNTLDTTVDVGDMPASLVPDANNNFVVLCEGLTTYDADSNPTVVSNSKIVSFNTQTYQVDELISFDHQVATIGSQILDVYDNTIYYLDGGVYRMALNSQTPEKIIDGTFYAIKINPENGDIWLANTSKQTQHTVVVYSQEGEKLEEYNTEQWPNNVIF
ncbi:MAG: hypothetical protein PF481_02190 [Bacteroidales bacterium]|jgi:YVTN family beta-propeller protein|nr:hypothetical protein [Bacteroidales bacterium]